MYTVKPHADTTLKETREQSPMEILYVINQMLVRAVCEPPY